MPRVSYLIAAAFLIGAPDALAQKKMEIKPGDEAPDFPPGLFSDGRHYSLSDFRGKVVVLFFYESQCPRCKGTIPERNELVRAFKDKPVKFLAVGASDTADDVLSYTRETGLVMPTYIDSLGLMESRYGTKLSLNNIWQYRVIGPDGKVVDFDMSKPSVEKALGKVKEEPRYLGHGYDAKLDAAADAFEWGQHAAGMKLLTPLRRASSKSVADSANKLFADVRKEADAWKAEAESAAKDEPLKAYDLYARITNTFPNEDVAKAVIEPMKRLGQVKSVAAELAARKAFADLETKLSRLTPAQRPAAAKACQDFAKKHPGTPSAEKAAALASELSK
jgi:peroxiredoxin